jgi:hypothetical protein
VIDPNAYESSEKSDGLQYPARAGVRLGGLQFPDVKAYDAGVLKTAVIDIIAANVRTSDMSLGDIAGAQSARDCGVQ